MLQSEHRKIKGSRSNKKWKLLTCFTNSLFRKYNNLSFKETEPEVYNIKYTSMSHDFYAVTTLNPMSYDEYSGSHVTTLNPMSYDEYSGSHVTTLNPMSYDEYV